MTNREVVTLEERTLGLGIALGIILIGSSAVAYLKPERPQKHAEYPIQRVQLYDFNKDGLEDVVLNRNDTKEIYYGTLEGKTTHYLTADQLRDYKVKQTGQEITKYPSVGGK